MASWHLHEVQDRCSARGPEGQREIRPSFASPGVCMCLTVMSSCGVNKFWIMYHGWERSPTFKSGLLEPALVSALCAYAGYISSPPQTRWSRHMRASRPPSMAQGHLAPSHDLGQVSGRKFSLTTRPSTSTCHSPYVHMPHAKDGRISRCPSGPRAEHLF